MKTNTPRQLRVLLAPLRDPVRAFLQTGRDIVIAMTDNTDYPTPFPSLADVTAALDDLEAKIAAAAGRGVTAIAVRNAAWAAARSLIRQLANYVQSHCQNDLDVLLGSGFRATKTPGPIGPLPAPAAPICQQGTISGTLRARTGRIYGASSYDWRLALASSPTVYVQTPQTGGSRYQFDGLTAGETYVVQVSAYGTAGQSNWSDAGTLMVV